MKRSRAPDRVAEVPAVTLEEKEQPLSRGRIGGALGLTSAALLLASIRWAHHWGPLTEGMVASWALATTAALVVSVWSLRTSQASRRFSGVGLALTLVSFVAVALAGILYAVGVDASSACGGG